MRRYANIEFMLGVSVPVFQPLRDVSLGTAQRAERVVGWVHSHLTELVFVLQPQDAIESPFEFKFTPERLADIQHAETSAPIWQRDSHSLI